MIVDNFGAAPIGVLFFQRLEFAPYDRTHALGAFQNFQQIFDAPEYLVVLAQDLLLLEPREPVQAQIQNRMSLYRRKPVAAVHETERRAESFGARGVGPRPIEHFRHAARRPDLID